MITESFDSYLAAHPPAKPAGDLASLSGAADFAIQIGKEIAGQFGKGRKEADRITPYQNQLGAPGGILNTAQILAADPLHNNADDLNEIYQITLNAVNTFYNYIGVPNYPKNLWPDGRASRQAYDSISPPATGILGGIKAALIAGGGQPVPIPGLAPGGIGSLGSNLGYLDSVGVPGDPLNSSGVLGGGSSQVLLLAGAAVLVLVMVMGGNK